jgi:uncharacterized protein YcbX
MAELKLTGIYIYPIKSAAGIALEMAQVEKRGFQHDRRWMLVDEAGKFITQRQFPQMALISVRLEEDKLVVEAPNRESLSIPYPWTVSLALVFRFGMMYVMRFLWDKR